MCDKTNKVGKIRGDEVYSGKARCGKIPGRVEKMRDEKRTEKITSK